MRAKKNKQKKQISKKNYFFWRDNKILWTIIFLFFSLSFVVSFLEIPFFTSINSYTLGLLFGFLYPVIYFFVILIAIFKIFNRWPLKSKKINLNFWMAFFLFSTILWLSTSIYQAIFNLQLNVFNFNWKEEITRWLEEFTKTQISNSNINPLFFPNWKQIGLLNLIWNGIFVSLTTTIGSLAIPTLLLLLFSYIIFVPENIKVKFLTYKRWSHYWQEDQQNVEDEEINNVEEKSSTELETYTDYYKSPQQQNTSQLGYEDYGQEVYANKQIPIPPNNYGYNSYNNTQYQIQEINEEDEFDRYQKNQKLINFKFERNNNLTNNNNSNNNLTNNNQWWNNKIKESDNQSLGELTEDEKQILFLNEMTKKGYSSEEILKMYKKMKYNNQLQSWEKPMNKNWKDDTIKMNEYEYQNQNRFWENKNSQINQPSQKEKNKSDDLPFDNPFD